MKTIALLAVIAMLLSAATAMSSVGGPLTDMLIVLLTVLAIGIYEAWSKKRGALGWVVSILTSVIGGFVAVYLVSIAIEMILGLIHFQGSLARSQHPLLYVFAAGEAIFTVLGSWIALLIVNRFR